ncbi:MAG: hypothetical protein LBK58_09440 [Prevotellaceae bacterium]|jgi:hypothetical protein|nr:hypothetical protein [Prevotellaceae bacterium]
MNQTEFLEKREKWLNEVSDECHEFASKIDLDFYVFQTPCDRYSPKLLIIGINSGGSKSYKEALKGKGYDKRPASDLAYKENTLVEKPDWEREAGLKGSDVMRDNLQKVFNGDNNLDILKETVMMNMLYFNTDDINKVKVEIRKYCIDKTLEFIDILNPQNILFFTGDKDKLKSYGVKNIVEKEYFIKQGILAGRTVYAIPSYGYYITLIRMKTALKWVNH